MKKNINPLFLIILDGFGIAPPSKSNAISLAKTPTLDNLIAEYPHATLQAAGEAVGLPWQNMGNSEVGHMNVGSGRIMYQDLPRINKSIQNKSFFENEAFLKAINHVKGNRSSLHLMGLLTTGGVHAHLHHLYALLELAKKNKVKKVFIHLFLDGRDVKRDSAIHFVDDLENKIKALKIGQVSSLCGRLYAMDRNQRWGYIEETYQLLTEAKGKKYSDIKKAIRNSYKRGVFDEEFEPTVITQKNKPVAKIKEDDAVIFFNFRSDRASELTKAFVLPGFEKFKRGERINNLCFVTMTSYDCNLPVEVAFKQKEIKKSLGEIFEKKKMKQLRVAETEKYAHVTVFLNCGETKPYKREERILVPSPSIETYDKKPEMSARQITKKTLEQFLKKDYDFVCINYANVDMVGHTGNIKAAIKAVEVVDECISKIVKLAKQKKGNIIIMSDHGNAEAMRDPVTGEIDKEHTANPVPFILVNDKMKSRQTDKVNHRDFHSLAPIGVLSDVGPTILELMDINQPDEMTGISLIQVLI